METNCRQYYRYRKTNAITCQKLKINMILYYQIYKYIDGKFTNSINEVYFQKGVIRDESYFSPLTAGFLHYSKLPEAQKGFSWVKEEGVLKLGE